MHIKLKYTIFLCIHQAAPKLPVTQCTTFEMQFAVSVNSNHTCGAVCGFNSKQHQAAPCTPLDCSWFVTEIAYRKLIA